MVNGNDINSKDSRDKTHQLALHDKKAVLFAFGVKAYVFVTLLEIMQR